MIYIYKATIPTSKVFMRVYEVKSDMTLFDFNSFINNDLGFSPDQMILFEGYSNQGELTGEYALFDMGDGAIDSVTFEMLHKKGEDTVHYVYNVHSDFCIKLTFIEEAPSSPRISYPRTTLEAGRTPEQFSKYEDIDDFASIGESMKDSPEEGEVDIIEEDSFDEE